MQLTLAEKLVKKLKDAEMTVTCAESCTGGLLCGTLVDAGGASRVLKQAYVTYCDEAKQELLGVKKETLEKYTAVSEETAKEMALGGAKAAGADACLSVTGIAGPEGGTKEQPVGLVYIGCCVKGRTVVQRFLFSGDRRQVREQAVVSAMKLLEEQLG